MTACVFEPCSTNQPTVTKKNTTIHEYTIHVILCVLIQNLIFTIMESQSHLESLTLVVIIIQEIFLKMY